MEIKNNTWETGSEQSNIYCLQISNPPIFLSVKWASIQMKPHRFAMKINGDHFGKESDIYTTQ